MVASQGRLVTVTGVPAGSVASLFTILPFGAARADRVRPEATRAAYAVIVAVAVALTGAALLGTTRRAVRGVAVAGLR